MAGLDNHSYDYQDDETQPVGWNAGPLLHERKMKGASDPGPRTAKAPEQEG